MERIICTGKLACRCPQCFDPQLSEQENTALMAWNCYGFLMDRRNHWLTGSSPWNAMTELAEKYQALFERHCKNHGKSAKEFILKRSDDREQVQRRALLAVYGK